MFKCCGGGSGKGGRRLLATLRAMPAAAKRPARGGSAGGSGDSDAAAPPLVWLPLAFLAGAACVLASVLALQGAMAEAHDAPLTVPWSFGELRASAAAVRAAAAAHTGLALLVVCTLYLWKQAFGVPGSAVLNAVVGCAFGTAAGVPLVIALSAAGATGGYLLSREFGQQLIRRWRLDERIWPLRMRVEAARKTHTLLPTLISLRVFPGTPHWLINLASPHAGVPVAYFISAAAIGMAPYNALCVYAGDSIATVGWEDVFSVRTLGGLAALAALVALPAIRGRRAVRSDPVVAAAAAPAGGAAASARDGGAAEGGGEGGACRRRCARVLEATRSARALPLVPQRHDSDGASCDADAAPDIEGGAAGADATASDGSADDTAAPEPSPRGHSRDGARARLGGRAAGGSGCGGCGAPVGIAAAAGAGAVDSAAASLAGSDCASSDAPATAAATSSAASTAGGSVAMGAAHVAAGPADWPQTPQALGSGGGGPPSPFVVPPTTWPLRRHL